MARPISKTTKFILSLPTTLSAKEVITKARAGGMKTSESNVHRVRRLHGGRRSASRSLAPRAPKTATGTHSGSKTGAEALLRAVAAEMGLAHAVEVLESERARVRAVLRH